MVLTSRRRFVQRTAAAAAVPMVVSSRSARAAEFPLRIASDLPLEHPISIRARAMWENVKRESGGRIEPQFFPNSQLGGVEPTFSQLRLGAIDFLFINPGTLASVVPVANIGYLGFAFKDVDEGTRAMDGALGVYVRNEVAAKGMHALRSIWDSGMLQILSGVRPVRVPDDLRGFKIRVLASKIQSELFKDLGATPTAITLAEIYTALQTKVVDGTTAPLVTIETAKWYEVQKYCSLTNHAWTCEWQIASGEVWRKLPGDLQGVIERNNTRFTTVERRDAKAVNVAAADKLRTQGITLNPVEQGPFRAELHSYFSYWANAFGSTAWGLLEDSIGRKLT